MAACGCTDYHVADCDVRTGGSSYDAGDHTDAWYGN